MNFRRNTTSPYSWTSKTYPPVQKENNHPMKQESHVQERPLPNSAPSISHYKLILENSMCATTPPQHVNYLYWCSPSFLVASLLIEERFCSRHLYSKWNIFVSALLVLHPPRHTLTYCTFRKSQNTKIIRRANKIHGPRRTFHSHHFPKEDSTRQPA